MSSFLCPQGRDLAAKKRARCGNRASLNRTELCANGAMVSQGQPAGTSFIFRNILADGPAVSPYQSKEDESDRSRADD
jgi:hypothetical protein